MAACAECRRAEEVEDPDEACRTCAEGVPQGYDAVFLAWMTHMIKLHRLMAAGFRPTGLTMPEWLALAEIEQRERMNYARLSMGMNKWLSQRQ